MASTLSHSAIQRIIFLVENDLNDPTCRTLPEHRYAAQKLQYVNRKWSAIYQLYMGIEPAPPLDYFDSLELALVLKREVDDEDVHAIFAHGKPLEFWGCPGLLVSKIVEAFGELQKEPAFLDVTVIVLTDERTTVARLALFGAMRSSEAWPQAYTTHLPCRACTTVETVDARSIPEQKYPFRDFKEPDRAGTVEVAVEKFHISSESFGKLLTVELHYQLVQGMTQNEREQCSILCKVTIRLVNATCRTRRSLAGIANRSSTTLLLNPDLASEVFVFLDRAHVGSALLANRDLHELLCQLRQRLPLHHLTCAFDQELFDRGRMAGWIRVANWLSIRHFQRDLSYIDVRCFKLPSTAGAENDCALIRRYLSNSHVANLLTEPYDIPFAIKMLASLVARNFSVGHVKLRVDAERLSDFRSMDIIFGGLRMNELHLRCYEFRFVELVKTTDFFRMSTVQSLRELKLNLNPHWYHDPRGREGSKSPLWMSGIYRLINCKLYRVYYQTDRHLRSIERKIVHICEEFERGKITDIVDHFQFVSYSSKAMNYALSRDNLLVSGMKVEGETQWHPINDFEWDVYRFRNATTNEYLTACVGNNFFDSTESILHLVKGEVLPDASFA